jgi:hypothetical protein
MLAYSDYGIWTPLFQTQVVLTVPLYTTHHKKIKVALVQALMLCTGRTARMGSEV